VSEQTELAIAVALDDGKIAERVAALLGKIPGLRLVGAAEKADLMIVAAPDAREPDIEASLTPRERDVLQLLAEGASNKVIARRLGISTHTAKFHVGRLLDKLDAGGRTDAVAHAARRGVIHL
jgi:DNA-binding CsgD family transcriptional regulator